MALNANTMGDDLYAVRSQFSNKTVNELVMTYGSMEAARQAMARAEAAVIINHFKANAEGKYQATTLVAGSTPVTASSPAAIQIKLF